MIDGNLCAILYTKFFKEEPMNKNPNPGSDEAVKAGCICPVMDNFHGKGIPLDGKTAFWINGDCPVHGVKEKKA